MRISKHPLRLDHGEKRLVRFAFVEGFKNDDASYAELKKTEGTDPKTGPESADKKKMEKTERSKEFNPGQRSKEMQQAFEGALHSHSLKISESQKRAQVLTEKARERDKDTNDLMRVVNPLETVQPLEEPKTRDQIAKLGGQNPSATEKSAGSSAKEGEKRQAGAKAVAKENPERQPGQVG